MYRRLIWILAASSCWLISCGNKPAQEAAAVPAVTEPFRMSNVFPPGPAQEKVLGACGSCHSVTCVTRGQRTAESWLAVKKGHQDKMSGASAADLDLMFSYLSANFNNTKPEPRIPAELMQQGCTPF